MLTLLAVYQDRVLKSLIDREELIYLLNRTIGFLKMAAQPSSALDLDVKILVYLGEKFALLPRKSELNTVGGSFTSSHSSGDMIMTGR